MEQPCENIQSDYDPFADDVFSYPQNLKKERWSVSWSDLMMTMFIFFVVMYVYQQGNRELEFGPGPGVNSISETGSSEILSGHVEKKPSDIYDQTKAAFKDTFVDETAEVDLVEDRSVRIALSGDLFFDPGRASLKMEARWSLDQIARIIQENSFECNQNRAIVSI